MRARIKGIELAMVLALVLAPAVLAVGGCAGGGAGSDGLALNAAPEKAKKKSLFGAGRIATGRFESGGGYLPSNDERALKCNRLRGKMGIRIAQLKSTGNANQPSALARSLSGFFGGQKSGLDGRSQINRDRAVLVSYNRLLAEKNCPTVDLDAALGAAPEALSSQAIKPQTR